MKNLLKRHIRGLATGLTAGAMLLTASAALAGGDVPNIERQSWTFGGITGAYDKDQLRRGYMVYKNVCSACHGLKRVYFRNLGQPGGPGYTKEEVEAFAAEAQVTDGPNDKGEMFQRAGKATDRIPSPYANDQAAAYAQNGAVPPDLSNIAKGRGATRAIPWYMEPLYWVYDIATVYQEQGPDYIYALMNGYGEPPVHKMSKEECAHKQGHTFDEAAGTCTLKILPGLNFNHAFPGNQIAMAPPLSDDLVDYAPGTAPATKEACQKDPELKWLDAKNKCIMTQAKYARDVASFLMWTAEPKLEERKRMGLKVMIYLLVLTGLLYWGKRRLWARVKH